MTDRVIEIASPARLSVRHAQLVIERPPEEQLALPFTTPISEIGVLLLAHPQVTLTQAVLSEIAACGGAVVTIDKNFLPASMLLPMQANSLQTERFAAQIQLSLPKRKRVWQTIIRAKIRAQGELLHELHGSDEGLLAMAARVRSGDPVNLEAQAAKRYWMHLFPKELRFRRGSGEQDQNRHLDYGYTVLRAMVARALCAAGLHPSIGIHHKNRYDPFCLAADLMEPFRPLIDRRVYAWTINEGANGAMDRRAKIMLIGSVTTRYRYEGEDRALGDIVLRAVNTLVGCILKDGSPLVLPSLLEPSREFDIRSTSTGVSAQ